MSSMFSRNIHQAIQPFRQSVRRYATEVPKGGGSNLPYILGGGALVAGGAYYYVQQFPSSNGKAPHPSEENKMPMESKKPTANKTFMGGDQGFVSLKLENVEDINHNTKKLRFALEKEDDVSGLHIASALLTKYKGPEMEKPVIRPYTPTSDEDARGYLDLVVKRYSDGPMSNHLHNMKPGQQLEFKGPLPKYPLDTNKHEHIALIAGGTGITPMWQLARAIFSNPEEKTKVTLVYGNVSEQDILLKKEWEELENTYPQRFRAFYVVDNPPENWQGGKGYITKELLKTVLPEPKEENIKVFVCGPPGLYNAISGAKPNPRDQGDLTGVLKELGYSKDQVYKF